MCADRLQQIKDRVERNQRYYDPKQNTLNHWFDPDVLQRATRKAYANKKERQRHSGLCQINE